jgi:hypothetical protein
MSALLQILRRLVLNGFPSDARSLQHVAAVDQVAPGLLQALVALQQVAPAAGGAAVAASGAGGIPRVQLAAMADRGVVKLVKTLHQIQDVHPWYVFSGQCNCANHVILFCKFGSVFVSSSHVMWDSVWLSSLSSKGLCTP